VQKELTDPDKNRCREPNLACDHYQTVLRHWACSFIIYTLVALTEALSISLDDVGLLCVDRRYIFSQSRVLRTFLQVQFNRQHRPVIRREQAELRKATYDCHVRFGDVALLKRTPPPMAAMGGMQTFVTGETDWVAPPPQTVIQVNARRASFRQPVLALLELE